MDGDYVLFLVVGRFFREQIRLLLKLVGNIYFRFNPFLISLPIHLFLLQLYSCVNFFFV